MVYTIYGPFSDGSSPPVNQTFLNNLENYLASLKGTYILSTPYHLVNSVSFTSGQTQTFTATGVGGVPGGAAALLVGAYVLSSTTGVYAQFAPNNGTLGQYFTLGNVEVSTEYCNGFGILPLDGSGVLKIKCNAGAGTIDLWMYGYIA